MRMLRVILIFVLVWTPGAWAATVGVITETEGEVMLLRGDYYYQAAEGVELGEQDIIETGEAASAQLDMADGSVLRLGADSRLLLSEYRLDDEGHVLSAAVDVLSGWLRFAVAKLRGDNSSYAFNTPVLTVGIRGTEGVIEANAEQAGLYLEEGKVQVSEAGELSGVAPVRIAAGEYISRLRARRFIRQAHLAAAFRQRMPPRLRHKLQHRARALHRRGVPPKRIRRIMRQDIRRYLDRHPGMRQRLRHRFRGRLRNDPEFRKAVIERQRRKRHPRPRPRP